jgi:regulator of cell morphogenesis and NO signaling
METCITLDVTLIEPKLKHPTIFENFDALVAGEQFIIRNDHDPKPLYYQLLGERGNIFSWDYLENGPEVWKVKIGKVNKNEKESVGEMVAGNYRKAEVFKKYGIDFCCGGKKTLAQVCKTNGLDLEQVEIELNVEDEQAVNSSQNYNNWDVAFLADYIVNTHHNYIRKTIPVVFEYMDKVVKVHSNKNPEVIKVAELFLSLSDELTSHMIKEENVLFPYIKQLTSIKKGESKFEFPLIGKVETPIKRMEHEHEIVGMLLKQINELTSNYTPPQNACTTFRVLYSILKEFESDLHQHIHLENNILFPKAIKIEKELL